MDKMFQLYQEDDNSDFLSYHDNWTNFHIPQFQKAFSTWSIVLGERKTVHFRRVYSLMNFLEDTGGFFGIIYLFGQVLNDLFSCKNPSIDYLTYYYRVSADGDDNLCPENKGHRKKSSKKVSNDTHLSEKRKQWLQKTEPLKLSRCQQLSNSSKVFRFFL